MAFQTSFDYIVIGGGTAGLVVAARLSENPDVSVCVIEAGKDQSTNVDTMIPGECFPPRVECLCSPDDGLV